MGEGERFGTFWAHDGPVTLPCAAHFSNINWTLSTSSESRAPTAMAIGDHKLCPFSLTYLFGRSRCVARSVIVCLVQTLVFCLLSTVYIGMAIEHHDHGEAH